MRYSFLILGLVLSFATFAQESTEDKAYSYTELFEMIAAEENSVFTLSNARITYNPKTDSLFVLDQQEGPLLTLKGARKDTLHIHKTLDFREVSFDYPRFQTSLIGFHLISFHKPVFFRNPGMITTFESTFRDGFDIRQLEKPKVDSCGGGYFIDSKFQGNAFFLTSFIEEPQFIMFRNSFTGLSTRIRHNTGGDLILRYNKMASRVTEVQSQQGDKHKNNSELLENDFEGAKFIRFNFEMRNVDYFKIAKNKINQRIRLQIDNLSASSSWVKWDQFEKGIYDSEIFYYWMDPTDSPFERNGFVPDTERDSERNINYYFDTVRVQDLDVYNAELALRGKFYDYYKSRHETEAANAVYREIKDLETERLAFLYAQLPGFNTFFKWKINQFLKMFSAYGTEPARAITYSVYVVLLFALVYLFFPNHWDSHGKNRIMDRYRFFLKYVNKDSGMHEVYLDEKKPELLASEDFKHYLQEQGKTAPKFFMATALPLYRWSVAGTKTFSWMLSKVDVLKGKWSDTEDSKRGGKSFLLITAFMIALVYDLFIKVLNALMLSINTFTTLGFGEIPIKGLPRYLAIIQGFIGWFMLTIFSVSLISQLLN